MSKSRVEIVLEIVLEEINRNVEERQSDAVEYDLTDNQKGILYGLDIALDIVKANLDKFK